MIETILPNLFRIEVPLPQNPLREVNSYIIKDGQRSLIIDTGQNREECLNVLSDGLRKLNVDLRRAEFFITHLHADHLGLVPRLTTATSKVYFNQPDAAVMTSLDWERNNDFARINGFPEDELQKAIKNHPGRKYGSRVDIDFHILKEGDELCIADYCFECIETPGHTSGHLCLYEPNSRIFISGDHILNDITPNISLWSDDGNHLNKYLTSLDKVNNLDVALVLPGHRGTFRNFKERIQELKQHHRQRVDEVLSILKEGKQTTYQIASQMSWDVDYKSWELFPPQQKWFAFGEAFSHVKYLEEKEEIHRETSDGKVEFSL